LPFWTPSIYRSTTLRMLASSGQRVLMIDLLFVNFPRENQWILAANLSKLLFVGLTQKVLLACGSMVQLFFCRSFFALQGEK
jgi:hypothetical protein